MTARGAGYFTPIALGRHEKTAPKDKVEECVFLQPQSVSTHLLILGRSIRKDTGRRTQPTHRIASHT